MDPIDQLPPDLSAVLSLLLRKGRSYADISRLLGIPEESVRRRAHAALDAISSGPAAPPSSSAASPSSSRSAPFASSAPSARRDVPPSPAAQRHGASSERPRGGGLPRSGGLPRDGGLRDGGPLRSGGSRRAGGILLGGILVVVIVAVVLIANSGGSSHSPTSASTTTGASGTGTSSTGSGSGPQVDKQLDLVSSDPASNAVGVAEIVSEGSKYAFLLSAEHLQPTSDGVVYVAWLYNSPSDAVPLGRAPSVNSDGKLQAVGALPTNATHFHTMLLTRETSTHPKQPGTTVLSGPFSIH
jgi:hypothetical protein